MFKDHHYLSGDVNKAARCYVAVWNNQIIGFAASIALPNGNFKNGWRAHRTVILPDFQGMGIGVRFSDAIGQIHLEQGLRYFSRTAHPRFGYYREHSPLWKATSKNKKLRKDITHKNVYNSHYADNKRVCFSHEYVGKPKAE